jgi:hypothetical protein
MAPLIFEPWVCEDCLAYALQVCPGLLKIAAGRYRHPLRLLRVRKAQPVAVSGRIGGTGPVAGQRAVTYVKALPLWQPWASLVALVGAKRVETRHWPAPPRLIGQRIAIHATKTTRTWRSAAPSRSGQRS